MKNIFNVQLFAVWYSLLLTAQGGLSGATPDIPQKTLTLIADIRLPFSEPSGIAWSDRLRKLWIVSGGDQHIYMLNTHGIVEKRLRFTGTDLEGITFDARDSTLWVIDEATKVITHLNLEGDILDQKRLKYSSYRNKGPEGIAIGRNHCLYILNERNPSVLFELDSSFSIVRSYQLNFARDYSDVVYDDTSGVFLILSDESKALFEWNPAGGVTAKYVLPFTSNEGIAFDRKRGIVFIVNDKKARLYFYRRSQ
jgi:uncharacterized protein YjiK